MVVDGHGEARGGGARKSTRCDKASSPAPHSLALHVAALPRDSQLFSDGLHSAVVRCRAALIIVLSTRAMVGLSVVKVDDEILAAGGTAEKSTGA